MDREPKNKHKNLNNTVHTYTSLKTIYFQNLVMSSPKALWHACFSRLMLWELESNECGNICR